MVDQERRGQTLIGRLRAWRDHTPKAVRSRRIIGWALILVVGLGITAVGVVDRPRVEKFPHWTATSGTVIESSRMVERGPGFFTVARYEVDGDSFTVTSRMGRRSPLDLGEVVEVRHDPADPSRAVIAEGTRWTLIRLVVGPLFVVATPFVMLRQISVDVRSEPAGLDYSRGRALAEMWEDMFRR